MVIALFFILIFLFVMVISNFKSKDIFAYVIYFLGIFLLLFSVLMYFTKFSDYRFPLKFDYAIYILLGQIRIKLSNLSWIYNIGLGMIMLSNVIFLNFWYNLSNRKILFLLLPVVFYVWVNSPEVSFKIYLAIVENTKGLNFIFDALKYICNIIFYAYIILPFVAMLKSYFNTKLKEKKKIIIVNFVSLAIMTLYVIIIFFWLFKPLANGNTDYFKVPTESINWDNFTVIPMSVFVLMLVVLVLSIVYKPFFYRTVYKKIETRKNLYSLNKSNYMLSHTYKNTFVLINKIALLAGDAYKNNQNTLPELLSEIEKLSFDAYSNIARVMNTYKELDFIESDIDILQCIDNAIKKSKIPENVTIVYNYQIDRLIISGDYKHLESTFCNLIQNAVDAVGDKEDAQIKISVYSQENYLFIEFFDNGIGIKKRDLPFVFNPLFSTKTGGNNFGVGLSHARKVIRAHMGYIYAKSEYGKYTIFQIVIPLN